MLGSEWTHTRVRRTSSKKTLHPQWGDKIPEAAPLKCLYQGGSRPDASAFELVL